MVNMEKYPKKAINRFESKVKKTDSCHHWIAAKQKQGYGMFSYNGKSTPAHRFAYLLYKGEIAENMVVHQTCEANDCVNPEHLVLQTKVKIRKVILLFVLVKKWLNEKVSNIFIDLEIFDQIFKQKLMQF